MLLHRLLLGGEVTVIGSATWLAVTDTIGAALIAAGASIANTILIIRSRRQMRNQVRESVAEELDQEGPGR